MNGIEVFTDKFKFNPELAFHVGVEREYFITNRSDKIVPEAPKALQHVFNSDWGLGPSGKQQDIRNIVGYELSACQIETRTRPCPLHEITEELSWQNKNLLRSLNELELSLNYDEVAPLDMPLDVYPDPTGRYEKLSNAMPRNVLQAACRVIGTHVHIGMPSKEIALRVYNSVVHQCESLCILGDSSQGERLSIYKVVAPNAYPQSFQSWSRFYEVATADGFVHDPRQCWTLIRISCHGTIEFRMFGTTHSIERITSWVKRCHELCLNSL